MKLLRTEATKLLLQGVTIVAASGDDGVANFQARYDASECSYNPAFPASHPLVLAVGGNVVMSTCSVLIIIINILDMNYLQVLRVLN